MKNKKIKILILSVWYPSAVNPGYGIFVRQFASAISSFAETVVLNVIPVGKKDYNLLGLRDTREDGVRVVRIYFKKVFILHKLTGFYKFFQGLRYLKVMGFKPDLVNAHVYYSALPALLSKQLRGVPLVVTEHSTSFLRPGGLGAAAGKIYGWTAKRAALVMPVSSYLQKAMKKVYAPAAYKVHPNIFDPRVFYYKKMNSGKEKQLLFVGGLIERKGIEFLLRAFAGLTDLQVKLSLVGEGPEQKKYEKLARDLKVSERVIFLGRKQHKEIAALMRKSDLYVHGSRSETFGCVLMEAMACGLPVVASGVGGVPEVVDKGSGILVKYGEVKAFTAAMYKILSAPGSYDREKIAARALVRFGNKKSGEKLNSAFSKIIKTSSSGEKNNK